MTTTAAFDPSHHSQSLLVVRAVQALIAATKNLPAWCPHKGWAFSPAWEAGAEKIMGEFALTPSQFLAFVRFVRAAD